MNKENHIAPPPIFAHKINPTIFIVREPRLAHTIFTL